MRRIAALLLLPLLLFAGLARAAVPTVDAVQAEVRAGRYAQAETMMREVVAARPDSAKAHYVLAEILTHNGQRDEALKEAREARRIDPAIRFTDAAKFESFEKLLAQPRAARSGGAYAGPDTGTIATPAAPTTPMQTAPAQRGDAAPSGGLPSWLWLAGAAVLAVVVWRMLAARRAAQPMASASMAAPMGMPSAAGYGPAGGGVAPGYGGYGQPMQPGMAPGRGPGMMGVGLGVAGGVAAGMLAERMLHGHDNSNGGQSPSHADGGAAASAGGLQPGVFDDAGDPLRDRAVDFGGGGGWDAGGSSADSGSSDGGSGGDGDGW